MNESLADIVKDQQPETLMFSEKDLDIPSSEATEEPEVVEEQVTNNTISVSSLAEWFEGNSEALDNINQVKVAIRGIDPTNTLIMAVKDGSGEQDEQGNERRNLRVFENADTTPVLDLTPLGMNIYNNGFRIIYQFNDNIFIKAYGIRTGLICSLCTNVGGKLIPYSVIKVKKKDEALEFPVEYPELTDEKISEDADLENLQLLYKQSAKVIGDLSTNQTVIDWLTERQESVTDINHHLQIDNVLISMLR